MTGRPSSARLDVSVSLGPEMAPYRSVLGWDRGRATLKVILAATDASRRSGRRSPVRLRRMGCPFWARPGASVSMGPEIAPYCSVSGWDRGVTPKGRPGCGKVVFV